MAELDVAQLPPPARRVVEICVGEERLTLEAFLDYYPDGVTRKVSGVSEADARRQLVSSATTLGGIIKHLRRSRSTGSNVSWRRPRTGICRRYRGTTRMPVF